MKQKFSQSNSLSAIRANDQAGFTLIELLVVIAIMALIMTALTIDFASQRARRSMVLAGNETVTNLRKVQSYMLSSKTLVGGQPVKYYIATFAAGESKYTVQAIDSSYTYYDNIETVNLPSKVSISSLLIGAQEQENPLATEQDSIDLVLTSKVIEVNGKEQPVNSYSCIQVIFSAPFGKVYTRGDKKCDSSIVNILKDPVQRADLSEKNTYIYFSENSGSTSSSYLELVPITGQMTTH